MYSYRVAKTVEERQKVLELVKQAYVREGYVSENSEGNFFEKYMLNPATKVFTAYWDNALFGTVSIIPDYGIGLPMDSSFKNDLEKFRRNGSKIAEVIQFTVNQKILPKPDPAAALPLMSLVIHYAFHIGLDYLCITIHPKHDSFYKNLGFEEIGEPKFYESVKVHALAESLDIRAFKQKKDLPGIVAEIINRKPDYSLFD